MSLLSLQPMRHSKPISLTALIDVVFILLMFFMLTSSFTTRFETQIQTATAASPSTELNTPPMALALNPLGHFEKLPSTDIADERWLQSLPAEQPIMVYPYGDTQVQTILSQLQYLRELELTHVNLGEPLAP